MEHPGYLGSSAQLAKVLREAYRRGVNDCIKLLELLREEDVNTATLAVIIKRMRDFRT